MTEQEMLIRIHERLRVLSPLENPKDTMAMISIVADARASARNRNPIPVDTIFGAGVLCCLFDWIKVSVYSDAARDCRRAFSGIYEDDRLRSRFGELLTLELLAAETVPEAIGFGFHNLFRPPYNDRIWIGDR